MDQYSSTLSALSEQARADSFKPPAVIEDKINDYKEFAQDLISGAGGIVAGHSIMSGAKLLSKSSNVLKKMGIDEEDINILIQDYNFIGWAWQTKSGTIQDHDLIIKLKPHQIYQSKWLVDKKFLYNRQNKNLSLAWIQDLKKFYKKQGFTEGGAYIDSWNKGVLKSCLRSGYKIKNWT